MQVGRGLEIAPAHDMRDALQRIVDDHGQMVARRRVPAHDHADRPSAPAGPRRCRLAKSGSKRRPAEGRHARPRARAPCRGARRGARRRRCARRCRPATDAGRCRDRAARRPDRAAGSPSPLRPRLRDVAPAAEAGIEQTRRRKPRGAARVIRHVLAIAAAPAPPRRGRARRDPPGSPSTYLRRVRGPDRYPRSAAADGRRRRARAHRSGGPNRHGRDAARPFGLGAKRKIGRPACMTLGFAGHKLGPQGDRLLAVMAGTSPAMTPARHRFPPDFRY